MTRLTILKNLECMLLAFAALSSTFIFINATASAESTSEMDNSNTLISDISDSGITASLDSNRFVVWKDFTVGSGDILFKRSTDNGVTWKSAVNISNNPGRSELPKMAVSGSNVYIVWNQRDVDDQVADIYFRHSPDNGVTWGPRLRMSAAGGDLFEVEPNVAAAGNNAYVLWENNGPLLLRRSDDSGLTFHASVNIGTEGGERPLLKAIGSNVYVVWAQYILGTSNRDIMYRLSTDNAVTWGTVKNVSNNLGDSGVPDFTVSNTKIFVVWQQKSSTEAEADTYFRRSLDSGNTWGSRINLSNSHVAFESPHIAVSGSNIYAGWIDITTNNSVLKFRRSTDGGSTWKPIVPIFSTDRFMVDTFGLGATSSNVYICWFTMNYFEPSEVFIRHSTNNGGTWSSSVNLSNNSGRSGFTIDLVVYSSIVYVTWEDESTVNSEIISRHSTDNGSSWSARKNISSTAGESQNPHVV